MTKGMDRWMNGQNPKSTSKVAKVFNHQLYRVHYCQGLNPSFVIYFLCEIVQVDKLSKSFSTL